MPTVNIPNLKQPDNTYQMPYQTRGTRQDFGTPEDVANMQKARELEEKERLKKLRADCKARGGTWDEGTQTCLINNVPAGLKLEIPEVLPQAQTAAVPTAESGSLKPTSDFKFEWEGDNVTITGRDATGKEVSKVLSRAEYDQYVKKKVGPGRFTPATPQPIQDVLGFQNRQQVAQQQLIAQNQALTGQVGQFEQLGVTPTGINEAESLTAGIMNAIPRALSYAATGLATGLVGGTAITPGAGTAIGAAAGLSTGFTMGIMSNIKQQRQDTTATQLNTLMEGRKNLMKLISLTASDPANKMESVEAFNKQLAQIDRAYRQMKLDTSRDITKFENAEQQLAEFEDFYQNQQGIYIQLMNKAILTDPDPDYIYRMQVLTKEMEDNNI